MGIDVNLGTGVNNYTQKALPTTAPNYTSAVQSSLLSQPSYDTVSFSGKVQQIQTQEKESMSTGTKVGLVAAAATLIVGAVAASRGKKINTANGEATKLLGNISTGLRSMFTKAGRESYKAIADKVDDAAKAIVDASGKAKPAREVTESMLESANKKGISAQEEVNKLQTELKKLEASRGTSGAPTDIDDQIKKLADQITEKQKNAQQAFKEVAELKFDKNMADDLDYAELLKTQERCSTQLTELTGKKSALQQEVDGIKTQREQLAAEIKKLKDSGDSTVNDLIKEKEALQTQLLDNFNKKNTELKELATKVTEASQSSKYAARDITAYAGAKKGYYLGEAQEGINKTILKNYQKGLDTATQSEAQQKMLTMLQDNVNTSWKGTQANAVDRRTAWEQVKEMIFGKK